MKEEDKKFDWTFNSKCNDTKMEVSYDNASTYFLLNTPDMVKLNQDDKEYRIYIEMGKYATTSLIQTLFHTLDKERKETLLERLRSLT